MSEAVKGILSAVWEVRRLESGSFQLVDRQPRLALHHWKLFRRHAPGDSGLGGRVLGLLERVGRNNPRALEQERKETALGPVGAGVPRAVHSRMLLRNSTSSEGRQTGAGARVFPTRRVRHANVTPDQRTSSHAEPRHGILRSSRHLVTWSRDWHRVGISEPSTRGRRPKVKARTHPDTQIRGPSTTRSLLCPAHVDADVVYTSRYS